MTRRRHSFPFAEWPEADRDEAARSGQPFDLREHTYRVVVVLEAILGDDDVELAGHDLLRQLELYRAGKIGILARQLLPGEVDSWLIDIHARDSGRALLLSEMKGQGPVAAAVVKHPLAAEIDRDGEGRRKLGFPPPRCPAALRAEPDADQTASHGNHRLVPVVHAGPDRRRAGLPVIKIAECEPVRRLGVE